MGREIALQRDFLGGEKLETIYFGGGTPSVLERAELQAIWSQLERNFGLSQVKEVTLEANPEDLGLQKLEELRALGINRLSIGIQSFHEPHLQFMHRSHSAEQALTSVQLARRAGFDNISIDLIYAIPHPSHEVLKRDLQTAVDLKPEHISAYCLTIEERTAFGKWLKTGKLKPVDEVFAAEQYELLTGTLERNGYEQYEISNFARNGLYSRHNSSYWQQKKYLGIGPGAHSYNGLWRQFNVANNMQYIKSLSEGRIPFEREEISPADAFNEYLLTSLRTKWGTSLRTAKTGFGVDLLKKKSAELGLLQREQLLFLLDSTLYLTKKGKLLADEVTSQLMIFEDQGKNQ